MKRLTISWRQKLITTSLLCLVLPSIITLALTGFQSKNELKKNAVLKAEQSLEVAELYVSNTVDEMINAMNSIQYDSELITVLRTIWSAHDSDKSKPLDFYSFKKISEKLDIINGFADKTYITILLPSEMYFTNYSTFSFDLSYLYDEPWIKNMINDPINTTHFLGVQENYVASELNNNKHIITISRSFKLFANQPNAYILISKPEKQFHQIFKKYEPDQIMMLKDSDGIILSQTDDQLIGQTIPPSYQQRRDTIVTWNETGYLSVDHTLKFANWSMQSLTAAKDITGSTTNFINFTFLLQILFFVIFSMVMFYLLRQLTHPIMKISRTAKKVEDGNLSVRSRISGKDDIGQLGLSFDRMLDRIKEMVLQIEWEQSRKRIVELELLQAQINPHFLFNTLNSIRLQVMMKGEHEISEIIESLSTLLRMTINRNNEYLPLHEEVGTVEHYMKLMNYRHLEEVELTINLTSETLLVFIPRFTLQPIIENAYIHGLNQKSGEIIISSRKVGQFLHLTVQDNGKGMTESELNQLMNSLNETSTIKVKPSYKKNVSGIGLQNVNERLKIIYGVDYSIYIESSPGKGVKITMVFPIKNYVGGVMNHV